MRQLLLLTIGIHMAVFRLPGNLARIGSIFMSQRWIIVSAILFMILIAATEAAIPAFTKQLLDKGFGNLHADMLWQAPAALIMLALVRGLAQFASNYFLNLSANNILLTLRQQMFTRMLHASAAFFNQNTASTLINTLVFEVNQVLQIFSSVLISLVRDSFTVLGLLAYLFYLNWQLTLIVALVLPPIGLLMSLISKRLRRLGRAHQDMTNHLAYIVEEASHGYQVIKIYGAHAYESKRFSQRAQALHGYGMRIAIASGLNQPITQLLAVIALSIIISIAIVQSGAQQITVGGFTAFVMAMLLMISPLKHLADINQPLQRGLIAAEMIFRLLDEPDETSQLSITGAKRITIERAQGALAFENISFTYPNSSRQQVLQNIHLAIQPGQVIALVGQSGSGKTTLVNLIPRFLVPQQGYITLDGIPIEQIELTSLRKQIAFVSQDTILFNDTIAANIAYGIEDTQQVDYARVEHAIQAAYLAEVVAALPQGMHTIIGDKGNQLSGGQRQRLAIARAIYKDAPILILDEATSALDSESERQIQAALKPLMQQRTTLVIAHRLSTIEQADQIVVLEQGRIVEQGSHTELLAHNQLYATLHRVQFKNLSPKEIDEKINP